MQKPEYRNDATPTALRGEADPTSEPVVAVIERLDSERDPY